METMHLFRCQAFVHFLFHTIERPVEFDLCNIPDRSMFEE
jgi:hypothetical protein